jgi:hypothetical protein
MNKPIVVSVIQDIAELQQLCNLIFYMTISKTGLNAFFLRVGQGCR